MNIFQSIALILVGSSVALPAVVRASEVNEAQIPANVEWLAHIDADQLRKTQTGSSLMDELIAIAEANMSPQIPVNPVLLINGLRGLTAFGTLPDFATGNMDADGVVVLEGTDDLIQVFRGLVAGFELENPEALDSVELGDQTILMLKNQPMAGTFLDSNRIAIGRSLESLESYFAVRDEGTAHIALKERFPTSAMSAKSGVFFGAFVDGLTGLKDLPAQARILQLAKQVSLQLGEFDEQLQLVVSLGTDSPKTAQQVSQVLQGIIALSAITQSGQPEFAALIQSARTRLEASSVHLDLAYPVSGARKWIDQLSSLAEQMKARKAEEAAKAEAEAAAQAAAEAAALKQAEEASEQEPAEEAPVK